MKNSRYYLKLDKKHCFPNIRNLFLILLLGILVSCSGKVYQKTDYTFYEKTFKLDKSSALRTDGVYVLDQIWTDENGGTFRKPKEHRFYKFYVTGQCNLTIDPTSEIATKEKYINSLSKDLLAKKERLFEGYYKLKDNKIVIQNRVVPRQQFEYKYGFIEKDSLMIVTSTSKGKGQFRDEYFISAYKEYYVFIALDIKNENEPQW